MTFFFWNVHPKDALLSHEAKGQGLWTAVKWHNWRWLVTWPCSTFRFHSHYAHSYYIECHKVITYSKEVPSQKLCNCVNLPYINEFSKTKSKHFNRNQQISQWAQVGHADLLGLKVTSSWAVFLTLLHCWQQTVDFFCENLLTWLHLKIYCGDHAYLILSLYLNTTSDWPININSQSTTCIPDK